MIRRKEIQIGGQTLHIETGRMAKQADGAVVLRYGDTVILVTAVAAKKAREGANFLPLTVDYRENQLRRGQDPRWLLPPRGTSQRERDTDLPGHRSSFATAVPLDLALRDPGHRYVAVLGSRRTTPTCWRSPALRSRSVSRTSLHDPDRRGPCGSDVGRRVPDQPDLRAARDVAAESGRGRIRRSRRDGRGGFPARSIRSEMLEGIYRGHEAIRKIIAVQNELIAEIAPVRREAPVAEEPAGLRDELLAKWKEPLAEAMRIKARSRATPRSTN